MFFEVKCRVIKFSREKLVEHKAPPLRSIARFIKPRYAYQDEY